MTHLPALLERVSLTGVDDKTALPDLVTLSEMYPFVEWALLYVPHKEGAPRNPSQRWRQAFFEAQLPGYSAVHLCGNLAFEQLLEDRLPRELLQADRLQLNINARKRDFTEDQVLEVYRHAMHLGPSLILQYHEDSAAIIGKFLSGLSVLDRPRVHVLMDESRGKGKTPNAWFRPAVLEGIFCGFAGGLGPDNIASVLGQIERSGKRYWPDMETGIRTDNEMDVHKAGRVLAAARLFRL